MHPKIREINFNKEVTAIKRPLSEKLAQLIQQHEEPIKKPISAYHLSKLTGIYQTKVLVNEL